MISKKMEALGVKKSIIREIFEYAKTRKAEIGEENVFDYSIGNPSIPAPEIVSETLIRLLTESDPTVLHGYTSAQGDAGVRAAISDYIQKTYGAPADEKLIYLTAGAAAALTISLNAILSDDTLEEVIVFAPFFPEYRVFTEKAGGRLVPVPCSEPDFQIDFDAFESAITEKTKAVRKNRVYSRFTQSRIRTAGLCRCCRRGARTRLCMRPKLIPVYDSRLPRKNLRHFGIRKQPDLALSCTDVIRLSLCKS